MSQGTITTAERNQLIGVLADAWATATPELKVTIEAAIAELLVTR